jgi:hypothetical protein
VNRWRQRLAELQEPIAAQARDSDGKQPSQLPHAVQNVRNAQNQPSAPPFEHSEQIEQLSEPSKASAAATDRALVTWCEVEEERAALVEHDGNIPRAWAEGFARLAPEQPPGDVPARRWLAFIDDVGRFLDSDFTAVAVAFGWGPHDLFGCDRDRPFARIDAAGLLWLLNGDRLIALTENTATIETRTGARQTYRRKPNQPGRVLAWEFAPCESGPSHVD